MRASLSGLALNGSSRCRAEEMSLLASVYSVTAEQASHPQAWVYLSCTSLAAWLRLISEKSQL